MSCNCRTEPHKAKLPITDVVEHAANNSCIIVTISGHDIVVASRKASSLSDVWPGIRLSFAQETHPFSPKPAAIQPRTRLSQAPDVLAQHDLKGRDTAHFQTAEVLCTTIATRLTDTGPNE